MTTTDIIALIVTVIGVASFAAVVTILFRNYIRSSIKEISLGQRDIEIVDLILYEKDPKVVKRQKATAAGKTFLFYAFLAIIIPLFGLSLYSRFKNNVTKFGDNMVMVVASGSMSVKNDENKYLFTNNLNNQFNTYDLIRLTTVKNVYSLQLYDVIAYRNNKGVNIIHRIVDIQTIDGERRFVTRGDANAGPDSYKPKFADIIGKYTNKRIPGIGVFVMFFQSYAGIVTIVSIVYCSFMISHFNKKLEEANENRQELLEKVFDMSSLKEEDPNLMTDSQRHVIYFKDYAYEFLGNEFLDKREMTEKEKEIHNQELEQKRENDEENKPEEK